MQDVLRLPSKSLADLKKMHGREWIIGYISMWLINLNDEAHVKTKMSPPQMEFTAHRIYDTYSLKITDLTLFFRNIKEGVYGEYYENLSQEKIMRWLAQYFELRCAYAEMESYTIGNNFSMSKQKIDPKVANKMFEGVGKTKVEHLDKRGFGKRTREEYHNSIAISFMRLSDQDLKDFIINQDISNPEYDEEILKIAEQEESNRLKVKENERNNKNT